MTNQERLARAKKVRQLTKRFYESEGKYGVQKRLKEIGVDISLDRIKTVASSLEVHYRDPKTAETIRKVVEEHYVSNGPEATRKILADKPYEITITSARVKSVASELRIKMERKKKEKAEVPPPVFVSQKFSDPPVLQITKEAWEKPGKRIGALSRIDWKDKGARGGAIFRAFKLFSERGCIYNGLNGGLVSKKYVYEEVARILKDHTHVQRETYHDVIVAHVLDEMANELNSVIPLIKKPSDPAHPEEAEYVRLYIMTSRILDGDYGERVAKLLEQKRRYQDIRVYKQGGDRTRIKGVGTLKERQTGGQEIEWVNPTRTRLPGQYASTGADKDIADAIAAPETHAAFYVHGGHGVSFSKPGGGERSKPRIGLPVLHVPTKTRPGDPSIALNQVGVRIVETMSDGETRFIETWSFRDLLKDERSYVTGIKHGANPLHRRIVEAIKNDDTRRGYQVGELSDMLDVSRERIEQEIQFLVEPKSLDRTTWPGLYRDVDSGRYNLHLDWFQGKLQFPWPYDKDYVEIRRLILGCLHAGYNTTDYEFIRQKFAKIILEHDITVVELVGDIIAGLKHGLVHRGQIIGNMNVTEQEIFAAELMGTSFYEVFVARFEKRLKEKGKNPDRGELKKWVEECLVLFLFIMGNHDGWVKEFGVTPGVLFRWALVTLLNKHIGTYLATNGLFSPDLLEIVNSKMIELPEHDAVYEFPGGIKVELIHPAMPRAATSSARAEQALDYSDHQMVDIANFHTTVQVEKWHPELGQRVAAQAGAMTPTTQFENTKLKRIDFGPMVEFIRAQHGRIFYAKHAFFNKPTIKKPISKDTDFRKLKKDLGLLASPIQPVPVEGD